MSGDKIGNTTCHCLKIRRGAAAVVEFYDGILKPSGVTVRQYSLLHAINEHEGCNLRELSEVTELDRSTLTRSLKPLLNQEFIFNAKKDNQRDSRLILTAKGFRTLQRRLNFGNKRKRNSRQKSARNVWRHSKKF